MPPDSLIALLIVVVAVLPGSLYTWGFERQASGYGVTLADRTFRFIAVSLLFHILFGWAEYGLYRAAFSGNQFGAGQFAAAWGALLILIVVPAAVGTVLGGLYSTRTLRSGWPRVRRFLTSRQESRLLAVTLGRTPAPRAWDNLFSEHPTVYIRLATTDGTSLAGLFAAGSYAAGYPSDGDLYLEEAWRLEDDGSFGDDGGLGYSLYIPASQIAWMELVPPEGGSAEEGGDDGKQERRIGQARRLFWRPARRGRQAAPEDPQRHDPARQRQVEPRR